MCGGWRGCMCGLLDTFWRAYICTAFVMLHCRNQSSCMKSRYQALPCVCICLTTLEVNLWSCSILKCEIEKKSIKSVTACMGIWYFLLCLIFQICCIFLFACAVNCLLHVFVVGSGENGNEVLYGTSDGRVGLVQIGKYDLCISP